MTEKTKLHKIGFKAYFITCALLSRFEGLHSMIAEQDLYSWSVDLLLGEMKKSDFIDRVDFGFGLSKKDVDASFADWNEYKAERYQ